jgi:hypothetical protein
MVESPSVTLFLATPRTGTQWLARSLGHVFEDLALVEHEPADYEYEPRRMLRRDDQRSLLRVTVIDEHFGRIRETLGSGRHYVEVGFPAFAAVPLFADVFGPDLRVVHLVRHPISTAASMVTHGWYQPRRRHDLGLKVAVTPFDSGVVQSGYGDRWQTMTPFEKCLFYWTEVHLYGLEVERAFASIPFLRLRFEHLFSRSTEALPRLTEFMGLPWRAQLLEHVSEKVDRWPEKTGRMLAWRRIEQHATAMEVAKGFGYTLADVEPASLVARYQRYPNRFSRQLARIRARLALRRRWRRIVRMLGLEASGR